MDIPTALDRDCAGYLASYKPTHLTPRQWAEVKPAFVDLVLRCEPRTVLDARTLASSLARYLCELADDADGLSVDGLVTDVNIANVLGRYEAQGMAAGTRGQHRARLNRFLRAQCGLSARARDRRRTPGAVRPLAPYSEQELTTLVDLLWGAPPAVRATAHSALILGVVHGVLPPEAREVVISEGAARYRGRDLSAGSGPAPLRGLAWTTFTNEQWKHARVWLTQHAPEGLRLHEVRLRDTWLVGAAQDPVSPRSVVALMRDYRIGRCAIEQVAGAVLDEARVKQQQLLRDF